MVEKPGIKTQAHGFQFSKTLPKRLIKHQVCSGIGVGIANLRGGMPGGGMANAAETLGTGGNMGFEYGFDMPSQGQVGIADYAAGNPSGTIAAAGTHGGDALHKLCFADGAQAAVAVRPVHGTTFDKDGADDIVAHTNLLPGGGIVTDVSEKFIQQIAVAGMVPKVMMGIANGQCRFQHGFGNLCQPLLLGRRVHR